MAAKSVTAVHKEIHKRVGEQEEPGQPAKQMRPVLDGEEEHQCDEATNNPPSARGSELLV